MPADKLANLMFVIRMALTEFTLAVKKKKKIKYKKNFLHTTKYYNPYADILHSSHPKNIRTHSITHGGDNKFSTALFNDPFSYIGCILVYE